ncbi:MAG TPA: cupin domain-containing protein [Spirochaetota bacterium]|nr:cupin domain-containing protein [Spirochaetota bacterium]
MVITQKEMFVEKKQNMRDGDGTVTITHYVQKENLKNARLLAGVTIPPNSSIGEHDHINETEYYIILKGKGEVNDNGIKKTVKEGDVVVTGDGAKHSIRNIGNENLELIAFIITY